MKHLIVGQKLYLEKYGSRPVFPRRYVEPITVTISKIGSKYFYIEERPRMKFDRITLNEICENGGYPGKCYLTKIEIFEERETDKLRSYLESYFRQRNTVISIEKLRKIESIVKGTDL